MSGQWICHFFQKSSSNKTETTHSLFKLIDIHVVWSYETLFYTVAPVLSLNISHQNNISVSQIIAYKSKALCWKLLQFKYLILFPYSKLSFE